MMARMLKNFNFDAPAAVAGKADAGRSKASKKKTPRRGCRKWGQKQASRQAASVATR
jgi:hypothetical protein